MDKDILWAWVVKNSIVVLTWATLAVVFNHWWIALFGLLFVDNLQTKHKTYRVCDKCGKHSPYADSSKEALDKARKAGWVHFIEGNKDYCPNCQREKV